MRSFSHFYYSFKNNAAAPIPVPTHIETIPNLLLVLFNSGKRVQTWRAPVHPSGCPKAIAPPFGFTFFSSIFKDLMQCRA